MVKQQLKGGRGWGVGRSVIARRCLTLAFVEEDGGL